MEQKLQFIKWKHQYEGKNVGKDDSIKWNGNNKRYLPGTVFLFNKWAVSDSWTYYKFVNEYYPKDPRTIPRDLKIPERIFTYIKTYYYEYAGCQRNRNGDKFYIFKPLIDGYVPDDEYRYYTTFEQQIYHDKAPLHSFTEEEIKTFRKAKKILVNDGERALHESEFRDFYYCARDVVSKYGATVRIPANDIGGKIREVITPVEYNVEDYPIVYGYNQFTVAGWMVYAFLMLFAFIFNDKVGLWIMWTAIWGAIRTWQIFKISGR